MKKNIIFICSGNTCRSPMAKYIFDYELKSNNIAGYSSDSAGMFCIAGMPASSNAIAVLNEIGIAEVSKHRSKPVAENALKKSDLIVCLTLNIKRTIQINYPELIKKLRVLKEFSVSETGANDNQDIRDPFGCGIPEYRNCRDEIHECIIKLIDSIKQGNLKL